MLKNITKFALIFITLSLLISPVVFAVETSDEVDLISSDNITNDDLFIIDDTVYLDNNVDGNIFIIANKVVINSQINGDAFIISQNITLDEGAYIYNNLFAISSTSIEIKGIVFNLYALAKNVSIEQGYIFRDAKILTNDITINGVIGRNAFFNCSTLQFNTDGSSNALIYGDLNYSSSVESYIPNEVVSGNINFEPEVVEAAPSLADFITMYIINIVKSIIYVLLIWLILLWITPKFLSNTNQYVGKTSWKALGFGTLSLILLPVAIVILMLLQILSQISIPLLFVYLVIIMISKAIFTIVANKYICSKLKIEKNISIAAMLILTTSCVHILTNLPSIGWLLSLIASLFGLGVITLAILPSGNKIIDDNDKNNKNKKIEIDAKVEKEAISKPEAKKTEPKKDIKKPASKSTKSTKSTKASTKEASKTTATKTTKKSTGTKKDNK